MRDRTAQEVEPLVLLMQITTPVWFFRLLLRFPPVPRIPMLFAGQGSKSVPVMNEFLNFIT